MAGHSPNHPQLQAPLLHDFLAFLAVLFGPLLKVQIVEQAHEAPKFLLLAVAQLTGKIAHTALHDLAMAQVEGLFVVFAQQIPGFFPCYHRFFILSVFVMESAFIVSRLRFGINSGFPPSRPKSWAAFAYPAKKAPS